MLLGERGRGVSEWLMLDCFQSEVQLRLQRRVGMGNQGELSSPYIVPNSWITCSSRIFYVMPLFYLFVFVWRGRQVT